MVEGEPLDDMHVSIVQLFPEMVNHIQFKKKNSKSQLCYNTFLYNTQKNTYVCIFVMYILDSLKDSHEIYEILEPK